MATHDDFLGKDILSVDDFSREEIDFILEYSGNIKRNPKFFREAMKDKVLMPLFFEPSTRTNTSFQMAMLQMSGKVADFDVDLSSIKKGEILSDTAHIIEGYSPDIIVIRHKKDGSAKLFADIISAPVINAGDGKNQHPTQTLLDLYTIKEIRGDIAGVKIGIAGDLKYGRTAHSLSLALSKYAGCEIFFISPESLRMPVSFLSELSKRGTKFHELALDKWSEILAKIDILYMTRIQRERFPEGPEGEQQYSKIILEYCLTKEILEKANVKSDFRIMHPLPKVNEIESSIDNTDYAYYFKQAENGLYVRKALLCLVAGGKSKIGK